MNEGGRHAEGTDKSQFAMFNPGEGEAAEDGSPDGGTDAVGTDGIDEIDESLSTAGENGAADTSLTEGGSHTKIADG